MNKQKPQLNVDLKRLTHPPQSILGAQLVRFLKCLRFIELLVETGGGGVWGGGGGGGGQAHALGGRSSLKALMGKYMYRYLELNLNMDIPNHQIKGSPIEITLLCLMW